jgi:hypothetical protein
MQITITAIFCHADDFFKAISWKNDPQCHLILAEIATIALTASRYFGGSWHSLAKQIRKCILELSLQAQRLLI